MLSNKVYAVLQRGILAHLWQPWMRQEAVDLCFGPVTLVLLEWGFTHPQDTCLIPEIRPGL